MKYTFTLILLFALSIANQIKGQVISNTVNKLVPCCSSPPGVMYSDSVDINSDNLPEVKITSMYGIDNLYYYAQGMNNTQISGCNLFGTPFTTYGYASMPSTPMGPGWTGWLPNSGFKYLGFRKINSPGDTTFGWIKVNFVGNASGPLDTIKISQYAYNSTPNVHLNAGQLLLNSISELTIENGVSIYPTVTANEIKIDNKLLKSCVYSISNIYGQIVSIGTVEPESIESSSFSNLSKGLYFVTIESDNKRKTVKILLF